ncbi:DNA/RNA non-specific endonuclease [Streptococcus hongkongensis]|nr:endonuclease [Streptococcus uberis]
MRNKLFAKVALLVLATSLFSYQVPPVSGDTQKTTVASAKIKVTNLGLLPFKKKRQLILQPLDQLKRANGAHIQLKDSDGPKRKRNTRLKTNPVGWHNYKFYFENGEQKAWLMNRGHLIGYQFSGLNEEAKNLAPLTSWLNSGSYKGMNASNEDSLLFYEKRLDSWLSNHPHYYLDYKVTPIYKDHELIPRQIELQYVGIDNNGKLIAIILGGKSIQDTNGISKVTLDNISPNASIDYATGRAQNTVLSATKQKAQKKADEKRRIAEEKRQAEEKAKVEAAAQKAAQQAEQQRQAAIAQAQAQQAALAQEQAQQAQQAQQASTGYTRDYRGRWHRPNGQYASKAEIAAAGLPW